VETNPSGLDLARALYADVVGPALTNPHTACLIGEGSEVLGFDSDRSADHEWGPRLQVFVAEESVDETRTRIDEALPDTFRGFPTRWFSLASGHIAHHIEIDTTQSWLTRHLPTLPGDPDLADWLAAPQQLLLQLTAGEVFRDDFGDLTRRRQTYAWYPEDLWRWLMASQWHLIGNTEPLLGRALESGDQRGGRLLTARLCRLVMEMVFLQQRRYQPYPKWFGAGFRTLPTAHRIGPLVDAALDEQPSLRSDGPLQQALMILGAGHNELLITDPVEPIISDFAVGVNHAVRPFPVLNTAAYIEATVESITDPALANLPRVGAIDQLTHSDDQLVNFSRWPAELARTYRLMLQASTG
jgi:hypothetical protein